MTIKANIVIPESNGRHETLFTCDVPHAPEAGTVLTFPKRRKVLQVSKTVWVFGGTDKLASIDIHCRPPGLAPNARYEEEEQG